MKLDNSKIHLKGKVWGKKKEKKKKTFPDVGLKSLSQGYILKSDALPTELFHQMINHMGRF